MPRELTPAQEIERSISKKFRKELWTPFVHAVKEYGLIEEGDHIAVCISGGKDSFLMAKLFQLLQRHSEFPFSLTFLSMDPGYNEANRQMITENAAFMDIPLTRFETDIFGVANTVPTGSPCYLCARMRRGALYAKAKELGCNKIALGHHLNDVIETTVMAMFYGSQLQGMLPMLHSTNFPGMVLIRPLYQIREEAILSWRDYNHLTFLQCACRFTENTASGIGDSKRQEVKHLIAELKKSNPDIEKSLFNALHCVCLDTFPGFKTEGERHSFRERFDKQQT